MLENVAYKEYKKSNDIHGTALYPAVMVAPIQKEILSELIANNKVYSVFDPFYGSGTALYEAMEISRNLYLVGCDINPLANLITKVKLQGVNEHISEDIRTLENEIKGCPYAEFTFSNKDKWFREDIFHSICIIRYAIMQIKNNQNRLFFWYMLCDVIRKYSNTRSSTYKLHIKRPNTIERMKDYVIKDYISSVKKNYNKFNSNSDRYLLYKQDTMSLLSNFDDSLFDISITSPPYGDNATTVPYGQFSMLPLQIIDHNDLELEGWEFENYSKIDSNSMGGKEKEANFTDFEKRLLEPYLNRICINKRKKVIRFFNDYFEFLNQLCRITSQYIVLTLGNRTVDRIQIDLTKITMQYLENKNFEKTKYVQREIPNKRTPRLTSIVDQAPVSSMNYEYVLIFKKQ